MGQYHKVYNISKKEVLHPHRFGDGLKLREFAESRNGTMTALAYLLAHPSSRGGGDFCEIGPQMGRWRGDRIAIIGDYAEDGDFVGTEVAEFDPKSLELYRDISSEVREDLIKDGVAVSEAW